jgi:hypothetical protein
MRSFSVVVAPHGSRLSLRSAGMTDEKEAARTNMAA